MKNKIFSKFLLCFFVVIIFHKWNMLSKATEITETKDYNKEHYVQKTDDDFSNKNFIVKNIRLIGKTKYDIDFISKISGIYIGDTINQSNIDMAIINLWNKKLFNNISIYKENKYNNEKEIDLFFCLYDLIEIDEVKIDEYENDNDGKMKENNYLLFGKKMIYPGYKISYNDIQDIKNEIIDDYEKKGYNEAFIKSNNIIKNINNRNILHFVINKGKKIEIEEIVFEGNKIFSDNELLDFMNEVKESFFIPMVKKPIYVFIEDNIKKDIKNIKKNYQSLGFRYVDVFLNSIWKKPSGNYGIKIKIDEGKKYYLGKVNIYGNNILDDSFLKNVLYYKEGDVYDREQIMKNIFNTSLSSSSSIVYSYLRLGNLFSKVFSMEKKKLDCNKIDLDIIIEEDKPIYLKEIKITGNKITKDYVIRRKLKTFTGDIFSPEKIKESISNLEELDLFDDISFKFIHDNNNTDNNTVNIIWNVKEKSVNEFQFQFGLGGERENIREFIGKLRFNFNNFSIKNLMDWKYWNPIPQGDGQKLSIYSQLGKYSRSYGISFSEPCINEKNPVSLTVNTGYSTKDLIMDHYSLYSNKPLNIFFGEKYIFQKKFGSILLYKWLNHLYPYTSMSISVNGEKYIYKTFNHNNYKYDFNNLSTTFLVQKDTTKPNDIFPLEGQNFIFDSEFSFPYSMIYNSKKKDKYNNNSSNIYKETTEDKRWLEYFKFKVQYDWYKEIVKDLVLKLEGKMGCILPYKLREEELLLPFQRFYMGGTEAKDSDNHISLRGYSFPKSKTKYITPYSGGNFYKKFILETRYLIKNLSDMKIWTNFFIEGGSLDKLSSSNTNKVFKWFALNKSIGFGIRIFWKPIGILGVDIGYPIDIKNDSNPYYSKWKTNFFISRS
ncbi:BamA/OMP85 family outer membrane protein [Blattabacterium cuenoti]|uniref:BamA/OMP85 family outer membrane protein n=1 Tax=Blattabacterium cuenoti TaxID=1653831 RepID=UPI00163D1919|nr:POTRA domain-containing protein [Blattabacterium cuenoti]